MAFACLASVPEPKGSEWFLKKHESSSKEIENENTIDRGRPEGRDHTSRRPKRWWTTRKTGAHAFKKKAHSMIKNQDLRMEKGYVPQNRRLRKEKIFFGRWKPRCPAS